MITAIKTDKLDEFIMDCRLNDMDVTFVLKQIQLFCRGKRGIELHDSAIRLIEGEVKIDGAC